MVKLGNPGNMGLCIACFIRDTAGALGIHRAIVQYIRPEIPGLVLGAFIAALVGREFGAKVVQGVSSVFLRYFYDDGSTGIPGLPARMLA